MGVQGHLPFYRLPGDRRPPLPRDPTEVIRRYGGGGGMEEAWLAAPTASFSLGRELEEAEAGPGDDGARLKGTETSGWTRHAMLRLLWVD